MRPDQLGDLAVPSDPQLHPDGRSVGFVVTRIDVDEDRYDRRIWLWDGETARALTAGPHDSRPRWSPDGTRLAFLRKGVDQKAKPQVALLPTAGGEAEVITDFALGVSEIEWSPDGTAIAVVATDWVAEWSDLEETERERRPRRITRLPFRGDNQGWLHDRRSHVYLVDPDDPTAPACLTPGDDDESSIAWSPDGASVVFLSARHDSRGHDPGSQVWKVGREGGDAKPCTEVGLWSYPHFDRGGNLYAVGTPDPWRFPDVGPLQRIEADGSLVDLTGHLDRSVLPFSPSLAPGGPQWIENGAAFTTLEEHGRIRVVRLHGDGAVDDVVGGDRQVTGVSPRPDGSAFAFTATAPTDPGELWWWEDGTETVLTSLNRGFREATPLASPHRFTFQHDGAEIEGWVYLPAGEEHVPVLLSIHGGPATQYGYGFFDEFQVYTGAGYGVVAINPRGSSGYGANHMRAVVGRWADPDTPDLRDLLAAVDSACAVLPRLDPARKGVMGGSYGGLATILVLAEDQSFASAVAERGLYSWPSFAGTSDIGPWFEYAYLRERLPDGWETLWRASPLSRAAAVTTPTLLLHSESDFRTPIEQAEQLFVILKRHGVETELVRFPAGEGHEMSRSGTPRHRIERFEIILDWHERHLR